MMPAHADDLFLQSLVQPGGYRVYFLDCCGETHHKERGTSSLGGLESIQQHKSQDTSGCMDVDFELHSTGIIGLIVMDVVDV